MQIVVLAGGLGTRMRPYTDKIPKSMLPINGRPFVDYQMALFKSSIMSLYALLKNRILIVIFQGQILINFKVEFYRFRTNVPGVFRFPIGLIFVNLQ